MKPFQKILSIVTLNKMGHSGSSATTSSSTNDINDTTFDEESGLMQSKRKTTSYYQRANSEQYREDKNNNTNNKRNNRHNINDSSSMLDRFQGNVQDFRGDVENIVNGIQGREGPKRDLSYDQSSHTIVLLRMYGSVWPKVLPYCIANTVWTLIIHLCSSNNILDLTLHSTTAHNFMSTLVSFLLVSRSNMTYNRFMESRQHLEECYAACRELFNLSAALTFDEPNAMEWRQTLAYDTIIMLHTAMDTLDFKAKEEERKKQSSSLEALQEVGDAVTAPGGGGGGVPSISEYYHSDRNFVDESFRAPSVLGSKLRGTILQSRNCFPEQSSPLFNPGQELAILGKISTFNKAFAGLKKLATTPFPFPLVQMTRWFLFVWIFTLPMTLIDAMQYIPETMIVAFFITYGFLGIEYVSMELDDPFGEDPSDFDNQGMAEIVYEDIYLELRRIDGPLAAKAVRHSVRQYMSRGEALAVYREDVQKNDFWKKKEY